MSTAILEWYIPADMIEYAYRIFVGGGPDISEAGNE